MDIGSNQGSALRASLPDASAVIAFEPHPLRSQQLRGAFARSVVRVEEVAVSDDVGTSVLRQGAGPGRRWTLEPVSTFDDSPSYRVATTSLTQYFAGTEVDSVCVRIGTAGHETHILAGAAGLISAVTSAVIVVDVRHMGDMEIERLTQDWRLFAFDPRGLRFVDISASPRLAPRLLRSGWCDPYHLTLTPPGGDLTWTQIHGVSR